jgi:hypothetical protein
MPPGLIPLASRSPDYKSVSPGTPLMKTDISGGIDVMIVPE